MANLGSRASRNGPALGGAPPGRLFLSRHSAASDAMGGSQRRPTRANRSRGALAHSPFRDPFTHPALKHFPVPHGPSDPLMTPFVGGTVPGPGILHGPRDRQPEPKLALGELGPGHRPWLHCGGSLPPAREAGLPPSAAPCLGPSLTLTR